MNAEEAMIARGAKPKKRERQDHPHPDKGRKSTRTSDRMDDRRSRTSLGRIVNFTPLNTPLDQVFMQIRDDAVLTWSDKLKGNQNKRPRNKYCSFHRDHGHDTSECYDLKQHIEVLIKQGKLQRFIRGRENPPRGPTWKDKGDCRRKYNGWLLQEGKEDILADGTECPNFLSTT